MNEITYRYHRAKNDFMPHRITKGGKVVAVVESEAEARHLIQCANEKAKKEQAANE